ncbi:MAG TPA: hypothetical protein VGU02_00220 [Gaiellaceae bacterium]|nr:hypothetical protein [Gaiellaceae bacterium]
MRVVASTVVRESVFGRQATGWIYDVDFDSGRVESRIASPSPVAPSSEANPRGGVRGGRGVAFTPSGVVVAAYDTLVAYDDDWQPAEQMKSPLFAGLHEIDWDGSALWAAATAIDAVLRIEPDGTVTVAWDPHAESGRALGLPPRAGTLSDETTPARLNHCHVNGVTRRNGALVVHLGLLQRRRTIKDRAAHRLARATGESCVVRLNGSPTPQVLARLAGGTVPTHNGQFVDDETVAVNDSSCNTLRLYDATSGVEQRSFPMPGQWLRGLEPLGDGRALLGTAPAAIHLVDLGSGRIERTVTLSDDPNEAVHGLAAAEHK